jgi:Rrf2 family transcriptional regulator, nitric oxide-sensitive transcriptional repressor
MQLSLHADYALRVLLYLGANPDRVVSTQEISEAYAISKHHLVRVVQTLGEHGYATVTTGRSGGVRLAREPRQIRLGELVRDAEPNLRLVECFERETNTCPIIAVCELKPVLREAMDSFFATLNRYTLEDLLHRPQRLTTIFAGFSNAQAGTASERKDLPSQ